jgi:transcriptional regulator of heat shock response
MDELSIRQREILQAIIEDYISNALKITAKVYKEAEIASIIGAGKLVESSELLEKLKLQV